MIKSGLVSVTFRRKTPEEICELCVEAGLKTIEWGGDVHVPAGDIDTAQRVRALCELYGLETCAYGSYYRVGDDISEFERCLNTAAALGAPLMRVWCGRMGSAQASDEYRGGIVAGLHGICKLAEEKGIMIAPEFHSGTLTDDIVSVQKLMEETEDIANLRFYWQPRWDWTEEERLKALGMVRPRLAYVHTFTWVHTPDIVRYPLQEGAQMWKKALGMIDGSNALIEFVQDDSDEALLADAATLNGWISEIAKENGGR